MSKSLDTLQEEALGLSADERALLVERLIVSLEPESSLQDAWVAEALRRETDPASADVPGNAAVARARASLA